MFVKVTKSGSRRYVQLVEALRNEDGQPRQRTIATLGRLCFMPPTLPSAWHADGYAHLRATIPVGRQG